MKLLVLLALVSQAAVAAPPTCKELPEGGQLEVVINETDSSKCFNVTDILKTLTVRPPVSCSPRSRLNYPRRSPVRPQVKRSKTWT